jgi:DNA-directed RNA polymerase subunit N (RpoN/RPB10)
MTRRFARKIALRRRDRRLEMVPRQTFVQGDGHHVEPVGDAGRIGIDPENAGSRAVRRGRRIIAIALRVARRIREGPNFERTDRQPIEQARQFGDDPEARRLERRDDAAARVEFQRRIAADPLEESGQIPGETHLRTQLAELVLDALDLRHAEVVDRVRWCCRRRVMAHVVVVQRAAARHLAETHGGSRSRQILVREEVVKTAIGRLDHERDLAPIVALEAPALKRPHVRRQLLDRVPKLGRLRPLAELRP